VLKIFLAGTNVMQGRIQIPDDLKKTDPDPVKNLPDLQHCFTGETKNK
jgi:hypothetical protein